MNNKIINVYKLDQEFSIEVLTYIKKLNRYIEIDQYFDHFELFDDVISYVIEESNNSKLTVNLIFDDIFIENMNFDKKVGIEKTMLDLYPNLKECYERIVLLKDSKKNLYVAYPNSYKDSLKILKNKNINIRIDNVDSFYFFKDLMNIVRYQYYLYVVANSEYTIFYEVEKGLLINIYFEKTKDYQYFDEIMKRVLALGIEIIMESSYEYYEKFINNYPSVRCEYAKYINEFKNFQTKKHGL